MTSLLPVYPRLPIEIVSAKGNYIFTTDGRRILDLYGGHAVTPLGHGHPDLGRALSEAHAGLDFYSNSVVMPVQEQAARAVLADSKHLAYVHFVNSGTEANEAALHIARRKTGRTTVVSFDCSFHGRTLASLSVTGLPSYQQRLSIKPDKTRHKTIRYGVIEDLIHIDSDTACVMAESVPSLAGVHMPAEGYYAALQQRCRAVGAMLIFDEVQGGVGRLGRWYAHELFGVQPDLVTLAKSLGGGFPVGALVTTAAVGEWITYGELGTTFGGGPMACAMVRATAEVIRRDGLLQRVEAIFAKLAELLSTTPDLELRGAGCLIGIETALPARRLRELMLERDILVGLSGHARTIRLLPSYITTDQELLRFSTQLAEVLSA